MMAKIIRVNPDGTCWVEGRDGALERMQLHANGPGREGHRGLFVSPLPLDLGIDQDEGAVGPTAADLAEIDQYE